MTWKSIANDIAQAVHNLNKSITRGENSILFRQKIAVVVDTVRLMLYSSRSMDKDSAHLQDQEVKEPLRIVLSTLAKLILSAKVVNDSNMDINSKIQRDAADVLNAVRKFVLICLNKNVKIEQVNPKFIIHETSSFIDSEDATSTASRRKSSTASTLMTTTSSQKSKYPLNQDLIVSLQTHAKQIVGSTDALCKASAYIHTVEQKQLQEQEDGLANVNVEEQHNILDQRARSNVILLFQNLSSQIGNYLAILSDIDISHMDASQIQSLPEFRSNKQRLYNSVGLLFSAVQTLTDTQHDLAACIATVEDIVGKVEDAIEGIFSNIVQMVGERKIWLMRNGDSNNIGENGPLSPTHMYFEGESSGPNKSSAHRGSVNDNSDNSSAENTVYGGAPVLSRMYNRQGSQQGLQQPQQPGQQSQHRPSVSTNATLTSLTRPLDNKALKRQFSFGHGVNSQDEKSEFWYLGYDYAEGDIEFTQEKTIKGGTLRALVERLTLHDFIGRFLIS
jgi:hypothetical protein